MRAVAIGLAFGLGGALLVSRLLSASLFGVSGNDLVSYGAACLVLAITATVASMIPARRASLVNPMEALRTE
jgi:ABC-type antimicrobial peptide transport system permease subunit